MLWIIEQAPTEGSGGSRELSKEYAADVANLGKNPAIKEHLANKEISYTRDEAGTLYTGRLSDREPIYVLAHGGLQGGPANSGHIAGLGYQEFGAKLAAKCGDRLTKRPVFLLVCYAGRDLAGSLGQAIADACKGAFPLYVPMGLMFINESGKPLVLKGDPAVDAANARLQRAAAAQTKAKDVRPVGEAWAGVQVGDATVTAITADKTRQAVRTHFGG